MADGAVARGGRTGLVSFGGGGGAGPDGNARPGNGFEGDPGRDLMGDTGLGDGFEGDEGRDDDMD